MADKSEAPSQPNLLDGLEDLPAESAECSYATEDPHEGLLHEIQKSIEEEQSQCAESERLLGDIRAKYSQQVQQVNAVIVKSSRAAVCFLCAEHFDDEDELRTHMALEHLGMKAAPTAGGAKEPPKKRRKRNESSRVCDTQVEDSALLEPATSFPRPCSSASLSTTYDESSSFARSTSSPRLDSEKTCPVCEMTFATPQSMRRHVQRKHPDRIDEIQKSYFREDKLSLPFACGTCGKQFAQKTYLQSHERRHVVGRRFPCELCTRAYPLMSELRKHMKRMHASAAPSSAGGSEAESATSNGNSAMDADEDMPLDI